MLSSLYKVFFSFYEKDSLVYTHTFTKVTQSEVYFMLAETTFFSAIKVKFGKHKRAQHIRNFFFEIRTKDAWNGTF